MYRFLVTFVGAVDLDVSKQSTKVDNSYVDKLFNFGINQFEQSLQSLSDVHCSLKVEHLRALDRRVNKWATSKVGAISKAQKAQNF